mmetsp:Transcript_51901/g.121433  ORF Transcript_51901/g.121433 Transcript_51901/m.121433 type:complete len:201 (+) Transcript_51901:572-1174(+)
MRTRLGTGRSITSSISAKLITSKSGILVASVLAARSSAKRRSSSARRCNHGKLIATNTRGAPSMHAKTNHGTPTNTFCQRRSSGKRRLSGSSKARGSSVGIYLSASGPALSMSSRLRALMSTSSMLSVPSCEGSNESSAFICSPLPACSGWLPCCSAVARPVSLDCANHRQDTLLGPHSCIVCLRKGRGTYRLCCNEQSP